MARRNRAALCATVLLLAGLVVAVCATDVNIKLNDQGEALEGGRVPLATWGARVIFDASSSSSSKAWGQQFALSP
jgi:hypothetical protein